jgi:SAM-dependent methyltransferase
MFTLTLTLSRRGRGDLLALAGVMQRSPGRQAVTIPKPKHLGPEYAAQFKDRSVADAYVNYPPYAAEVFQVLDGLIQDEPRIVLDVGCGTGDVARPLAALVERVDAVDPSAAMIEVGRARAGGDRPNIRWVCRSAEEFDYDPRYSLIVAGASLHWMDWYQVIPRMAGALSVRGYLAIVGGRGMDTAPWMSRLNKIIPRYSTNKDFEPYSLLDELERRQLFAVVGRKRTAPQEYCMSVDKYVELFHARNGFSRQRMDAHAANAFDAAVRELVTPFAVEHGLTFNVTTDISWGHPLAGTRIDRH